MNTTNFSQKIGSLIQIYSASTLEVKAETLTRLRQIILTVKSREVQKSLRQIEEYFKNEIRISKNTSIHETRRYGETASAKIQCKR